MTNFCQLGELEKEERWLWSLMPKKALIKFLSQITLSLQFFWKSRFSFLNYFVEMKNQQIEIEKNINKPKFMEHLIVTFCLLACLLETYTSRWRSQICNMFYPDVAKSRQSPSYKLRGELILTKKSTEGSCLMRLLGLGKSRISQKSH